MYSLDENYEEITVDERNNTIAYKPVSKENMQIWNFIEYSNAKKVAENMYHNEDVRSGLMTGRQFDTIMRWAISNGYNLFTSSGGLEIAKMNEIYDIAGNVFEFTTDLYEGEISLVRGGCAAYSGKKDSTHPVIATSMGDSLHYVIGFSVVLYIRIFIYNKKRIKIWI